MNFTQLDDHKLIVPFHYPQLASAPLLYSSIAEFDNATSANLDLRVGTRGRAPRIVKSHIYCWNYTLWRINRFCAEHASFLANAATCIVYTLLNDCYAKKWKKKKVIISLNIVVCRGACPLAPSNSELRASVATVEMFEAWCSVPPAMKLAKKIKYW